MNTWKVICATLVIFVTGVVTGGLLVSYADRTSQKKRPARTHEIARPSANNPNSPPAAALHDPTHLPGPIQNRLPRGMNLDFLQKLDAILHLTPGQRERIEQVITDGQLRNREIMERVNPELRREMKETQKQIRDVLTPEQRVRFEEIMKQRPRRPLPPRDSPLTEAPPPAPARNP